MTRLIIGETLCVECGEPIEFDQKFGHGGSEFRHQPCPPQEEKE